MNYQDMKRSRPLARLGGSIAGLSARSRLEASVAAPEQAPLGTWLGSVGRLVRVSRALVRVRVSRAYWLALLVSGAPVRRTLLQRLWCTSSYVLPGELELLALRIRHANDLRSEAELREGKAGCRLAGAQPQQPYTQGACSGHLQHTSSDLHGRGALTTTSAVESCNSVGAAPAAGGAPRARLLLLSSRGRRPGDVVGCGRGSTGRATSRAARVRPRRRTRSASHRRLTTRFRVRHERQPLSAFSLPLRYTVSLTNRYTLRA